MKKYLVAVLLPIIFVAIVLSGCEKKQAASPPPAQPVVTAPPAPEPAPAPAPEPAPAPAKPAKK